MNTLPPFFILGTVGLIITAVLHVTMTVVLGHTDLHGPFLGLYTVFMAFLFIGTLKLKPIKVRSRK